MFMHQPKLETEAHAHEGPGSRDCVGILSVSTGGQRGLSVGIGEQ